MNQEVAYTTGLSLAAQGNEHLIEEVIPSEHLEYVRSRLRTTLAEPGPANVLSDVDTAFWYSNDYFQNAKHWPRYRSLVERKPGWGKEIAEGIDLVTTQIMNQIPNPQKSGFSSQGLVVGYVQSGKTANYTGVMAKAVDAGYNLIIVFAGLHNNLRTQTQIRLDRELTGENQTGFHCDRPPRGHKWTVLTKDEVDFYGHTPPTILQNDSPILMVVKKNCTVLRRLEEWLNSADDDDLSHKKVLIIDDEADHGSINIGKYEEEEEEDYDEDPGDLDPSETNRLVRVIRNFFGSYAFIGYTATPFANVLTSPFEEDEWGRSLYPSDFIMSLPKPDGYIGTSELFPEDPDEEVAVDKISIIAEEDSHIMINGGRPMGYDDNQGLPPSLIMAMVDFVLTGIVKMIRNEEGHHHSMLIHTSHLVDIQNAVHARVSEVWKSWKNELEAPSRHDSNNVIHALLEKRWNDEFPNCKENWGQIRKKLANYAQRVVVREINSESEDLLDYERYRGGMKVIAIGGNRLSRGLTLEGLTVSYYTRESKMYDTLLQMSRWFGFRPGYDDLMRIHVTATLKENFGWLAYVEEAIRRDIAQYELQEKSPMELAVRILTHAVLKPTAKLKPGSYVVTRTGWNSTPVETVYLNFNSPEKLQSNLNLVGRFVFELEEESRSKKERSLWKNVPHEQIVNFIKQYESTGLDAFDNKSLCKYITNQAGKYEELTNWSVYIAQSSEAKRKLRIGPVEIGLPQRSRQRGKARIGRLPNPFDYSIDLPGWRDAYKDDITGKHDFKKMLNARNKDNGLLIIYILDKDSETWKVKEHQGIANPMVAMFDEDEEGVDLVALSMVFPASETAENESYMHVRGISPIE